MRLSKSGEYITCLGLGRGRYSPIFLALSFVMRIGFLLALTFYWLSLCHIKNFSLL